MVLRMALRAVDEVGPEPVKLGFRRSGVSPVRMTPARQRVLAVLARHEPLAKGALAAAAQCGAGVIDALAADGVLVGEPLPAGAGAPQPDPRQPGKPLDPVQAEAAGHLRALVAAGTFGVTLLEGVTGSGKTDVYFEAVAAALEAGRQVLILLPEIALTTQFLTRFTARFGVPPAEWHSGVGARARARLRARSSLFLPFETLGLIVVDEEHEPAYKQDEGVTYHARDMAVVRGRLEGAAVILASATPSIETKVNAERGRYAHVRLAGRHGGRAMPALSAVDLRQTPPPRGQWIAPPLLRAMAETLERGEQSLLFLNRRGYAPLTLCRACGHRFRCPHCAAWLVEHRFRGALVCHHCGHAEPKPTACPACHAADSLVPCGPGVERLADNVTALFPEARTLLLSSDFPGGTAKLREELEAVAEGRVDIVIGTQLVAKGHHFPQLTLVGVVDADVGLANGDPRAAERTFQILQQVTGRAGRGDAPGRGLIQTFQPGHPVIAALLSGQADRFYATEIEGRQAAGLPPFGRLAAVIVSGTDRHAAETHARALAAAGSKVLAGLPAAASHDNLVLLGPAEAPIAMVRGRHRFRLLLKAAREVDIQAILRDLIATAPRPRGDVAVAIDVDPQSFL
jgi:primosomal protein N' (replication factor Y)